MTPWHIGEILIQKKLINWQQLEEALNDQKRTQEFVGEVLVRKKFISRYLLFKALAERHAMPFVDLSHVFIDSRIVGRVPRSVAVKYGFVPIEMQDGMMVIGISDPYSPLPRVEIAELAGVSGIKTVLCTPDAVAVAIDQHYGGEDVKTGAAA